MEQTNEAMFCFPLDQTIFQILTLTEPFKYLYSYQSSKLAHPTNSTNLNAAPYARIYYCSDGKIKETADRAYQVPRPPYLAPVDVKERATLVARGCGAVLGDACALVHTSFFGTPSGPPRPGTRLDGFLSLN